MDDDLGEWGLFEGGRDLPGELQVRFQLYRYEAMTVRMLTIWEQVTHATGSWIWCHDLPAPDCRVYWGSHGCDLNRGHTGEHWCECGCRPYYGRATNFYGEDAPAELAA